MAPAWIAAGTRPGSVTGARADGAGCWSAVGLPVTAAGASVTGTGGDATGVAGAGMIPAGEAGAGELGTGEAGTTAGVAGAAVTAAGGGPDSVAGSPRPCRSAAANSSQLAYRSAGALASALASTASAAAGRPGWRDRSEGTGSDRCAWMIATPRPRGYTGSPHSSSKAVQASPY